MNNKTNALHAAMENIDSAYLEEALSFKPKMRPTVRHIPKLSAACVAVLVALGVSVTAFAVSRIPLSWRDIFGQEQTVIGDEDETPVASQQAAATEELQIKVEKAISDERTLYLLYSVKANDGAILDAEGHFAAFDMHFPDRMMSGAYQQYLLARKDGVPENEWEGVIYADWQPGDSANGLVLTFSDWQEAEHFDDVTVAFNMAELVESAGENAKLPALYTGHVPQYLWQPGDAEIELPYGGITICNAGWEDGILQLVMKGATDAGEWTTGQNWYFLDTRTGAVLYPEQAAEYHRPDEFDSALGDADWRYFWNFVAVDREALPYLELHWGGKDMFTTVLSGEWTVTLDETPVTVQSEVLAESVPLSYGGETLLAEKIECSKLSMAVYFADYIDSTTGILGAFEVFDASGDSIPCEWGFTADQTDDSCMIWTQFKELIDPKSICRLTFDGETMVALETGRS